MCGIGGIKRMEDDSGKLGRPIAQAQVDLLLNSLEYRGNDASGVALISPTGIAVYKDHVPAWTLTSSDAYKTWISDHLTDEVLCVLVHTRKWTRGSPFQNKNNHPLMADKGAIVHNGMISNDDALFSRHKYPRSAETDSDILRAILDAHGGVNKKALESMSEVSGSVASALAHPADPTKLMLLRSGNPLVTADDGEQFYWASDKRAIYQAARPWIERHGFLMQLLTPGLAFVTMPNDTGWIIGNRGKEWNGPFTASAVRWRQQTYSDVYSPMSYESRQRRAEIEVTRPTGGGTHRPPLVTPQAVTTGTSATQEELASARRESNGFGILNYIFCPNTKCGLVLSLSPNQEHQPISRFRCKSCKTNLAGAAKTTLAVPRVN